MLDFVAAIEGCSLRRGRSAALQQRNPRSGVRRADTESNWLRKKQVRLPRSSLPCAESTVRMPTWRCEAFRGARPRSSGSASMPDRESSVAGWSFPSTINRENWWPIAAAPLDGSANRATASRPVSPNRKSCLTCHRAAAAGKPAVVVVEGFFDCFQLHQAGLPPVVALMGSALYEPQQRPLLQRFQRVILLLDGDAAGRRATARLATRLRPSASPPGNHSAGRTCSQTKCRVMICMSCRRRSRSGIRHSDPLHSGGSVQLVQQAVQVTGREDTERRILLCSMRSGLRTQPAFPSPRQLPTDHDCAVPTRGYQSDQPSHLPLVPSPVLRLHRLTQSSKGGDNG